MRVNDRAARQIEAERQNIGWFKSHEATEPKRRMTPLAAAAMANQQAREHKQLCAAARKRHSDFAADNKSQAAGGER